MQGTSTNSLHTVLKGQVHKASVVRTPLPCRTRDIQKSKSMAQVHKKSLYWSMDQHLGVCTVPLKGMEES